MCSVEQHVRLVAERDDYIHAIFKVSESDLGIRQFYRINFSSKKAIDIFKLRMFNRSYCEITCPKCKKNISIRWSTDDTFYLDKPVALLNALSRVKLGYDSKEWSMWESAVIKVVQKIIKLQELADDRRAEILKMTGKECSEEESIDYAIGQCEKECIYALHADVKRMYDEIRCIKSAKKNRIN